MAELIEETADKLVLRKLIPASREEVFAACSDPASIRHWMCPGDTTTADAQIDFRVGGSFRIVMKGGKTTLSTPESIRRLIRLQN